MLYKVRSPLPGKCYNALKAIGELPEGNTGKSLSALSDSEQIASWAKDTMTLMAETRTVSGSDGKLDPKETTTRARWRRYRIT